MRSCTIKTGVKLCFSRWNRKGYAIFASLGREVHIGRLAIQICEMSLRKASRKGVIVELAEVFESMVREFEGYAEKVMRACRFAVRVACDVNGSESCFKTRYKGKGTSVYKWRCLF